MMKKLLLVLSLLSVVGLQAAACLPYVEVQTNRTHRIPEKNRDVKFTLTDGTECTLNVWQLETAYNDMCTLVSLGTSKVFTQDKNYMKTLLAYGKGKCIFAVAKKVMKFSTETVFDCDTFGQKDSVPFLNYKFLKTFFTEDFEIV